MPVHSPVLQWSFRNKFASYWIIVSQANTRRIFSHEPPETIDYKIRKLPIRENVICDQPHYQLYFAPLVEFKTTQ
jgi:hypothetical protein